MIRSSILILVLFFVSLSGITFGQNICPNPGFEQLSGCPSGSGEINLSTPWTDAGTPADLFSFCHVNGATPGCNDVGVPSNFAGNSAAHGGSTYAGFYTKKSTANERTYIQAPLTTTLANGQLYKITAFFKRSSASKFATNRIGISFSTGPLSQTGGQFIPVTPQAELTSVVADTGNWTELKSYYTGTGLEDQLVIGNFRNDAATTAFNFTVPAPSCAAFNGAAFYYVDDVSVIAVNEQLNVTGDTLICIGESTTLTGITNTEGWWSLLSAPADTIPAINNSITVSPAITTSYLWHGIQKTYTVTVSVAASPVITLPADTIICDETSVLLDATNISSSYLWSTGATTPQIQAADSGLYIVTVNNGFCEVRDSFLLEVLASPDVFLGGTATICSDNEEFVTLNAGPGISYLWLPTGDTTSVLLVTEPGIYSVEVTHANGCNKSDSITISEMCTETLFVPGAFTPNSDGKNDLFYADGTNILNFEIIIFNRWGQQVFASESLGIQGAWNGKDGQTPVPAGLYSYIIHYDALKTNGKLKKETNSGYFILFR
jgi:gliding motility-associated-like protein